MTELQIALEKLLEKEKYLQSVPVLEEMRPLLDALDRRTTREDSYVYQWAWYYQGALSCYRQLGRQDELTIAQEAVEHFGSRVGKVQMYSQDYRAMRYALRTSFATIARFNMEKAQWVEASASIDACFSLKAGDGEWKDPFSVFYALRMRIYRAAAHFDPDGFKTKYLAALDDLEKRLLKFPELITTEDKDILGWMVDPEFLDFKGQDVVSLKRKGPEKETWSEALRRYDLIRKTLKLRKRESHTDLIVRQPRENENTLQLAEQAIGFRIPSSLREFYSKHGAFVIRDTGYWDALSWGSVRIYGSDGQDSPNFIHGLVDAVVKLWGGRPEFGKNLERASITRLNDEWKCFGHYLHNDDAHTFLIFDRSGQFSRIYYNQDEWSEFQVALESLLSGTSLTVRFDELMSVTVNDLADRLIAIKAEQMIDRNCRRAAGRQIH